MKVVDDSVSADEHIMKILQSLGTILLTLQKRCSKTIFSVF